jgi:hypothetical protein
LGVRSGGFTGACDQQRGFETELKTFFQSDGFLSTAQFGVLRDEEVPVEIVFVVDMYTLDGGSIQHL